MADVQTVKNMSSFGTVVIAGLMGQLFLLPPLRNQVADAPLPAALRAEPSFSPHTFGHVSVYATGGAVKPLSTLQAFYGNLLDNQEGLGLEIESILFDNLWDLYSR